MYLYHELQAAFTEDCFKIFRLVSNCRSQAAIDFTLHQYSMKISLLGLKTGLEQVIHHREQLNAFISMLNFLFLHNLKFRPEPPSCFLVGVFKEALENRNMKTSSQCSCASVLLSLIHKHQISELPENSPTRKSFQNSTCSQLHDCNKKYTSVFMVVD